MIHSIVMATLMAFATPAGGDANLAEAAMHRDMVAVRSLLNQKADANAPERTALPPSTGSYGSMIWKPPAF